MIEILKSARYQVRRTHHVELAMVEEEKRFWDGDLYALLDKRLTDRSFRTPRGQLSIAAFATAMQCTSEGLYKYLRTDKLSVDGAKKIVAASNGKIKETDLIPFLFA